MKIRTKHIIYVVVGIVLLGCLYALKNTNYFFRASAFIASFFLFWFVDMTFNLRFRNRHYLIMLFITTTGILFSPLYWIYPLYDKVLHFFNPILFCIIVFYFINRVKGISFSVKLFLTFSVTVSMLAMWELVEFSLDWMYDFKLQGVWLRDVTGMEKINLIMDRNDDTMIDLGLGVLGSLVFSAGKAVGFFVKKRKIKKIKK